MSVVTLLVLAGMAFPEQLSGFFQSREEIHQEFYKYYERFRVEGSFVLYDPQTNTYIFYNKAQSNQSFIPASTFKICNTLIGLETGVVKNEQEVIRWDSVPRPNPTWNSDQNLSDAFRNSTVWYFQELARRIGGAQMKFWLDQAHYGNADTTGGIDQFWLKGGLRITPLQQIDFLKRLYHHQLPFSAHSEEVLKKVMIVNQTKDDVLRAKSGWAFQNELDIGWYVGYLEKNNQVYFFSNCIQTNHPDHPDFAKARSEIVDLILKELQLIDP